MSKAFSKEIKNKIKQAKNIAVFCHISPDVDAIGSMYGLGFGLQELLL